MPTSRDDRVLQIREHLTPADEGALWVAFSDDPYGEPVLTVAVADALVQMDSHMITNLATIIRQVDPKAVLLVVPRRAGEPLAEDRDLWTEITRTLDDTSIEVLDLLVVGQTEVWSARDAAT